MKPKIRGYKEGEITQTLKSLGGTIHVKGSIVRYRRFRNPQDDGYEYHYLDQDNMNLIRDYKLLV